MVDWRQHVSADLKVCHGKACITGTRVMVSVVLDNVAEGLSAEEIVREYPSITTDDVRAALAYAADLTRERFVSVPSGGPRVKPRLDENMPETPEEMKRLYPHSWGVFPADEADRIRGAIEEARREMTPRVA